MYTLTEHDCYCPIISVVNLNEGTQGTKATCSEGDGVETFRDYCYSTINFFNLHTCSHCLYA